MEALQERPLNNSRDLAFAFLNNPISGAFDLGKLQKFLSGYANSQRTDEHITYFTSFGEPRLKTSVKSRYYSRESEDGPGWDCNELYRASVDYRAEVKIDWASDRCGDWESNQGPSTIGKLEVRSRLKEWRHADKVNESITLQIDNRLGKLPTCRVVLKVYYSNGIESENNGDTFRLTRNDYLLVPGAGFPFLFFRNARWGKSPEITEIPTESFLRDWAVERYNRR